MIMRTNLFTSSRASSPSRHSYSASSPLRDSLPSTPRHTFSASLMEENVEIAEQIIAKWDLDSSSSYSKIASLFGDDRTDAKKFLRSVRDLQAAMHFFTSDDSSSERLIRAQGLMQVAMKRLENEFYLILSKNRSSLDPESVSSRSSRALARSSTSDDDDVLENEFSFSADSLSESERVSEQAMSDLKSIADCMISKGYGKECVKIYKLIRKSIVDESLNKLGVDRVSLAQIQKMEWEAIESKIKTWLSAVKISVSTVFHGERILCDHVFSASVTIAESCFAEISTGGTMSLFGFPEKVAKSKKLSPEKMFRILDLYGTLSELWPEIEFIFSYESMSSVKSQAITSLVKLGDAVRSMLSDFVTAIQKDTSKSAVPGGGVHPLTRYVMNYVVFLCDYDGILTDIVTDSSLTVQSPLPKSYFPSPAAGDVQLSAISVRLAWIILVLLCKLDSKAELYKDVSLSYLFLANNLNYVVSKVRSSNLMFIIGEDWLAQHETKVEQYAANYERMGWSKVMSSLPDLNPTASISPETARECFRCFNTAFDEVYRKQASWIVSDTKLREDIKTSLVSKLVTAYRAFYENYHEMFRRDYGAESIVRYAPEDIRSYLLDWFCGTAESGSNLSLSSSPPSLSRERRVR